MPDPESDSDTASTTSFKSATSASAHPPSTTTTPAPPPRYPPEEEATHLAASHALKASANALFARAAYSPAIQSYDKALAALPAYLDYDAAVLRANIAACHLKLAAWKEAETAAGLALEALERVDPVSAAGGGEAAAVQEVDDAEAARIEALAASGYTLEQVRRLRGKALLRRARARMELGGWAALQGADEDYKQLLTMPEVAALDRATVQREVAALPGRLEEAKTREMGEMMGKLKELGNGILKPFGLSTDNFNFVKDEGTGGYSMQFNQGRNASRE